MTSFLVTYGSGEGQTAKVATSIDSVLTERGHDVTTMHVFQTPTVSVEDFDAVLVGASLNNRRHQPEVVEFVERNRAALADRPSAFFQLSMASAIPLRWARESAMDYVEELTEATGWRPDRVGLFAGAVNYTRYDRPTRLLFQLVSMLTTGDTDTSRDYEYTDWDEVERFAVEFDEFVQSQLARQPLETIRGAVTAVGIRRVAALGVGLAGAAYWLANRRRPPRPDSTGEGERAPREEPVEPIPP